jgi:hypothetical protein
LNLYAESTMRQEAEAFGTANRPDLFNMLDMYFREPSQGEVRRIPLPRTPVNKGKKRRVEVLRLAPAQAGTQTFSAALEVTSPHEPAYDQRSCVIAFGMETAPWCGVSTRASSYGIRL